jgi:hypothetical protein
MAVWATIVLTLGSSVIAAAAAIIATERQSRHATRERLALAEAQRRERAAGVIGRLQILLGDIEPTRVAMNINNQSLPLLLEAERTWRELRDELAVFTAAEGSHEIRDLGRRLAVEITNTANRLCVIVQGQQPGSAGYGDEREILEAAKEHFATANRLIGELLEYVHRK